MKIIFEKKIILTVTPVDLKKKKKTASRIRSLWINNND